MSSLLFRRLLALSLSVWCPGACGTSGAGPAADAGRPADTAALDTSSEVRSETGADSSDASVMDAPGVDVDVDVERSDTGLDNQDGRALDAPGSDQGGSSDTVADTAPADHAPTDGAGVDTRIVDAGGSDAPGPCGPCMERWVCGGAMPEVLVTLVPVADECHLSGLSGNKLLRPDGTITEDGVVVGSIMRTSARVRVAYPDGGEWLYCASPPTCTPWP